MNIASEFSCSFTPISDRAPTEMRPRDALLLAAVALLAALQSPVVAPEPPLAVAVAAAAAAAAGRNVRVQLRLSLAVRDARGSPTAFCDAGVKVAACRAAAAQLKQQQAAGAAVTWVVAKACTKQGAQTVRGGREMRSACECRCMPAGSLRARTYSERSQELALAA